MIEQDGNVLPSGLVTFIQEDILDQVEKLLASGEQLDSTGKFRRKLVHVLKLVQEIERTEENYEKIAEEPAVSTVQNNDEDKIGGVDNEKMTIDKHVDLNAELARELERCRLMIRTIDAALS